MSRTGVPRQHIYIALYKPRGYLADFPDALGRPTVQDLVPIDEGIFPVGRLDLRSEGLMLLTSDGKLAHRLIHPRYGHEREYLVLVQGVPSDEALRRWRRGVELKGRLTAPAQVEIIRQEGPNTWLRVIVKEGRKRQLRKVAASLGHPVLRLIRIRIGPVRLGNLKPGQWRHLSKEEIRQLRRITGLSERSGR